MMNSRLNKFCRDMVGGCLFAGLIALSSSAAAIEPITADFQSILHSQNDTLSIWRYVDNKDIVILDFPGLAMQGRTFARATQLSEQFDQPYKRVLSNEEITKYLDSIRRTQADYAYGYDLLISELALFYNLAERDKIELFPEEISLRDFLIEEGMIKAWNGIYRAIKPDAVVLSIPQMQEKHDGEPKVTELARLAVFSHEIAHGEYYTNPYYANYCRSFWNNVLTASQKEAFKKFLGKYNYSVNADELLVNEMQAYLMFTPDPSSFSASKLGVEDDELEAMREAFRKGKPPTKLPLK
jgi:hypothetical protein